MYARNLNKTNVRASPVRIPTYEEMMGKTAARDENSYGGHLPPGYVGNRFRPTADSEIKHHAPIPTEPIAPPPEEEREIKEAADNTATPEESEENQEPPTGTGKEKTALRERVAHSAADLASSLRNNVTEEDLLLALILLILFEEGENASTAIPLLVLLLLVK